MLHVKRSKIKNAGDGLFATSLIPEQTFVKVNHGPESKHQNLAFHLSEHDDQNTPCIFADSLTTIRQVKDKLHCSVYTPRYVTIKSSDALMKANDRAWPSSNLTYNLACLT